jgi:serine/tyrosine/threonine adenylyltransferase
MAGFTLTDLPKSNVFTNKLPADPAFETPAASHQAPRESLGPRLVKDAVYTFVRPEEAEEPELLGVSPEALKDLGIKPGEEKTDDFKSLVSGNKIFWDEHQGGIYPWAQCYGGKIARGYIYKCIQICVIDKIHI